MEPRQATGVWLALGIGFACLLTAGGSMTTTDAVITYDVTRAIVEHGSIAMTGEVAGYEAYRGVDGRLYSPFGIAQSIWNIPFYVAGRSVAALMGGRAAASQAIPKAAVALATVPTVALLAWMCFRLLLALGAVPTRAVLVVLLLVFGTSLWPYSGFGFNQPLAALFLWAAVFGVSSSDQASVRRLALAGACAGLAILTRHEMALAAVLLGGYVSWTRRASRPRALAWYSAGLLPMAAAWAALNWWRFGNPIESGYFRDDTPGFGSSVWSGAAGLLFSPYSSILLYSPIVLLAVAGIRALWLRRRPAAVLFALLFVSYLVLYASLGNWMGGRSYGPRYLVPFLPALVLPLAFWTPSRRWRYAAVALAVTSIAVQLPGVLVDYSKVRMDRAAAGETLAQDRRWSGTPLLLNARASLVNARHAAAYLAGVEPRPQVTIDAAGLSAALSFSLDFWWLYLSYVGVIGRFGAMAIAVALAGCAGVALRQAWLTAASSPTGEPRRQSPSA